MKGMLLNILKNADGIDIDGTFCREFNLDTNAEGDEWAIDVDLDADGGTIDYRITMDELLQATQRKDSTWMVAGTVFDTADVITITPYNLSQIK